MPTDAVTSKLLIAGSLAVSTGFLIPLSNVNPVGVMIPIYFLSLGGLAVYTYLYSEHLESDKRLPEYIVAGAGLILSVSFTITNALTYNMVFDLTNPLIITIFTAELLTLTVVLAPNEIAG
ncbi:hypothetical protein GLT90_00185 [Nanohaloarchaea archaeon H12]|jgi:hypothetical protein|nr:hypothetical protein [Nanohaloarchaea archaeon H12]